MSTCKFLFIGVINSNLSTNISWSFITYRWQLIKSSKSPVNKGFFANNSFQLVMTYYFVLTLSESIIRAKSRAKIIKNLRFSLGKRTVAMWIYKWIEELSWRYPNYLQSHCRQKTDWFSLLLHLQRADFRTAVRESTFILIKSLVMLPRLCYNIKCNLFIEKGKS